MTASTEQLWAYHTAKLQGATPRTLARIRNKIALQNDKLAISVARRAQERCDLPLDDLMQLSRMGLLRAIEKFDPSKNVALSSFAVPFCEGEIKHYLRDQKGLLKTPRRWQEKSDEVRNVQAKMATHGRVFTADEVATVGFGLPGSKWRAISHATQYKPLVPLDEALQVAADEDLPLEELEEREAIRGVLLQRLGKLEPQIKRCIVEKFWGDVSDEVIARRQGISAARVKALIEQGLNELKGEAAA